MRKIVFWQNFLSPHQAEFISATAAAGVQVTLVVDAANDADRARLGWKFAPPQDVDVVVAPTDDEIRSLLVSAAAETWHICSFSRAYKAAWSALRFGVRRGNKMAVYSEYFARSGLKGRLRLLRGRIDYLRFGKKIRGLLAVGQEGTRWFRDVGYPRDAVFEFGYFVGGNGAGPRCPAPPESSLRICYAGRLVRDKGVDLVVSAIREAGAQHCRLVVIGDGPERASLERKVHEWSLSGQIRFLGQRSHEETVALIAENDLLLLPSRGKEGWGVVVNEALLQGVRVCCSDTCGSATLLRQPWLGEVVGAGDRQALARAIREEIATPGGQRESRRERIRDWAKAHIGVKAGAAYLLGVLDHLDRRGPRPNPPWQEQGECF